MSQVRFLVDENLPLALVAGLRRREPTLDVWRVGQNEMPAFGTSDAEILIFCEQTERLFLSLDRASVPGHVHRHIATGDHNIWSLVGDTSVDTANGDRGLAPDLVDHGG